jgi:hypothetical protein
MPARRPDSTEYDDYYTDYVAKVEGDQVLEVLEAQLGETRALLGDLDDAAGEHRYALGKWSLKELLGHLVDSERVFAYRALAIARGDRASLPGMDQDDYVAAGSFDRLPLATLLEEFEHVRRSTLALLAGLEQDAWGRSGIANGVSVTVRALAFIIAGHQAHHLGVVRERYLELG